MSATTSACSAPRTTAFVWWSISSIDTRTVDLVPEHDLAEGIAHEEQRDPGFVEDPGGGVVVGGQHRDRCPSACIRAMSATVRRRPRCRSWRSFGYLRGMTPMLPHSRDRATPRVPAESIANDAIQQPVGDVTLGQERPGLGAHPARRSSRGSCPTANPAPGSSTSFATMRSTPLRRAFSGNAVERPGLGREPDEHRPRGGLAAVRARRSAARLARGCPRPAPSSQRAGADVAAASFLVAAAARPEVGDRGGHDEGVERRRAQRVEQRGAHRVGVFACRGRGPRPAAGRRCAGHERHRRAAVAGRPRRPRRPSAPSSGSR